jgi:hypothetical protein
MFLLKNKKLFYICLIAGTFLIIALLPYIWFGISYLINNPNDPCYSMPEPPNFNDPLLPESVQSLNKASTAIKLVNEIALQEFGDEFVAVEEVRGNALITWIENRKRFKINQQKEHWNPKIEEMSRRVFESDSSIWELEYRMYYNKLLTYWVKVPRNLPNYTPTYWKQPRYSECTRMY